MKTPIDRPLVTARELVARATETLSAHHLDDEVVTLFDDDIFDLLMELRKLCAVRRIMLEDYIRMSWRMEQRGLAAGACGATPYQPPPFVFVDEDEEEGGR